MPALLGFRLALQPAAAGRGLLALVSLVAISACSAAARDGSSLDGADGGAPNGADNAVPTAGAAPVSVNPLGRARCQAPAGVSASPTTTEQAVALLNALPKPTSVACFVESLARPLQAYATSSIFSAQPALSEASPRVFLKLGQLWLSVVVDGDSSYLVEFGYRPPEAELTSVKGELKLPLLAEVAPSAPFDRVRDGRGTKCGACHYNEQEADSALGSYASIAFRPRPETQVSLEVLRADSAACDWTASPHRCEMLSALFDGGAVVDASFPDGMATFY